MERGKPQEGRPPDEGNKTFELVWLNKGGKKSEPGAAGKELEVLLQRQPESDDDGQKNGRGSKASEIETMESIQEEAEEGRNQFPIKLEFKIPRDARVFNCAMKHRQ